MDAILIIYLVMGGMMFLGLLVALFVIAGKDIKFAMFRLMKPQGCEVWVVNHNRQISHYYKVPKDGEFRIKGSPYITNPDKVMSMTPAMRDQVQESINKKQQRIQGHIDEMNGKLNHIELEIDANKDLDHKQKTVAMLLQQKSEIEKRISVLEKKKKGREQVYYHKRRAAFLYIENDPVPKDFHEWYTEMDSIMLDNMAARALTKDPRAVRDLEKLLGTLKWLLIGSIAASFIAALLVFQNHGILRQIAEHLGVVIRV